MSIMPPVPVDAIPNQLFIRLAIILHRAVFVLRTKTRIELAGRADSAIITAAQSVPAIKVDAQYAADMAWTDLIQWTIKALFGEPDEMDFY